MTDHGRKVEHAMEIAGGMVGELAEAHTEIDRLRAEVEALSASLREKDDRTPSGKRSADYWLRMLQAAEARLEAVEALCEAAEQSSRAEADPPDQHALPVSLLTTREVRAALSVAPQPEPDALVDCLVLPDASCTHPKCRSSASRVAKETQCALRGMLPGLLVHLVDLQAFLADAGDQPRAASVGRLRADLTTLLATPTRPEGATWAVDLIDCGRGRDTVTATNGSALTTIVRVLSETYTDPGVLIWLNAKNKQLRSKPDGNWACSPAEYIAAGHAAEVLECARRIEGSQ
jgi:hypothetical protein